MQTNTFDQKLAFCKQHCCESITGEIDGQITNQQFFNFLQKQMEYEKNGDDYEYIPTIANDGSTEFLNPIQAYETFKNYE